MQHRSRLRAAPFANGIVKPPLSACEDTASPPNGQEASAGFRGSREKRSRWV
jgi:hypothetical protein